MYQVYDWNAAATPSSTTDLERATAEAVTLVQNAAQGRDIAYLLVIGENEWALRFAGLGGPVKLYGSEIPAGVRRANQRD
ncbi:MAG TPA: hypothetical protein VF103_02415 [Polyangiaceae bacterium]